MSRYTQQELEAANPHSAFEQAEAFDADERWGRENGEFDYAVFSQNAAKALRAGTLTYGHVCRDPARTLMHGGREARE